MEQCVNFYKTNSDNEITTVRLDMVENILQSAYVDDISCHRFRGASIRYFIQAYDKKDKI